MVYDMVTPYSMYNLVFNDVTFITVWNSDVTSNCPSLVPITTLLPSISDFPSTSPSLRDRIYVVNVTDLSEHASTDGIWNAKFEVIVTNYNPFSAGSGYTLEGTKVKVL